MEYGYHFRAGRHFLDDVVVLRNQLFHALLDGSHVIQRKGALKGNIVVKAFVNHRANDHFCRGIQLLDRVPHQVRTRVADDFHAFRVFRRNDLQSCIMVDGVTSIYQAAIYLACHRIFGQTGANGSGNFGHGYRAGKFAPRTVGESDVDCIRHDENESSKNKSPRQP